MEQRRSGPPVIVEVAKGTPGIHSGAEESAFNERWQGGLKPLTAAKAGMTPSKHIR
jgi:hypothetical protein